MPPTNDNAAAVLNPLRHGLSARTIAIPGVEDHGDWLNFRDAILESLAPDGALEHELAGTVAECLWRRRRVARAEQQAVEVRVRRDNIKDWHQELMTGQPFGQPDERPTQEQWDETDAEIRELVAKTNNFYVTRESCHNERLQRNLDAVVPERLLPEPEVIDKIIRYEAHLSRQLYQAMHALEALQAKRRGEPTPLARVSVHGLPGT